MVQYTARCSHFFPYVAKYSSDSKLFETKVVNGRSARHGRLILVKSVNKFPAFESKISTSYSARPAAGPPTEQVEPRPHSTISFLRDTS